MLRVINFILYSNSSPVKPLCGQIVIHLKSPPEHNYKICFIK